MTFSDSQTFAPKVLSPVLCPGTTNEGSPLAQRPYSQGWTSDLVSLLLGTLDFSKSVVVLVITDK